MEIRAGRSVLFLLEFRWLLLVIGLTGVWCMCYTCSNDARLLRGLYGCRTFIDATRVTTVDLSLYTDNCSLRRFSTTRTLEVSKDVIDRVLHMCYQGLSPVRQRLRLINSSRTDKFSEGSPVVELLVATPVASDSATRELR